MNHALQRMTALLLAGVLAGSGMTAAALATPEQAATPEAAAPVLPPEVPAATPEQTEPAALGCRSPGCRGCPPGPPVRWWRALSPPSARRSTCFDYWITTWDAPDNTNPPRPGPGHQRRQGADFYGQSRAGPAASTTTPAAPIPRTGMVLPTLQEGYPQLTASGQSLKLPVQPPPCPTLARPPTPTCGIFCRSTRTATTITTAPRISPSSTRLPTPLPSTPRRVCSPPGPPRCWDSSFPSTTTSRSRASTPATLPSTTISA